MNNTGVCKYCGEEKKLCNAHIIPETFYNIQKTSSYLALSNDGTLDCVHSQNGLKDESILCAKCDAILGNYDKYGADILKNKILQYPQIPIGYCEEQMYLLTKEHFDYTKLRKFFISLIWRASISKLCNVSLGKYEAIALKILKDEIPDNPYLFGTVIFHQPQECKWKDIVYITSQKLCNQKGMLITFPDYEISILANCNPIKSKRIFQMLFFNSETLSVIETSKDLNKTQDLTLSIFNKVKREHGGKLPKIKIR